MRQAFGKMANLAAVTVLLSACVNSSGSSGDAISASAPAAPLRLKVKVLNQYPHDRAAYTQGLLWFDSRLFESTGQWGQSTLRRVELETGAVEKKIELGPDLFGEGLARVENRLFQLTFKAGRVRVYDLYDFRLVDRFHYDGEGWGLCFDGRYLFMSDGSATLTVRDPETFHAVRRLPVQLDGRPVTGLNELECAEGWIYANVYQTDTILRIDPVTGDVRATIDAVGLLSAKQRQTSGVLNGIAYKSRSESFLLTGKNWPSIFEVIFVEAESRDS